jgi:ATP-binding cassette, subfamily F, member 3
MILIRNLSLSFQSQTVFDAINLSIAKNQRIGLFGLNGAGKSTLLKIIAGTTMGQSGSISIEKQYKIGYMPQEVVLESEKSIFEETLSGFTIAYQRAKERDAIEQSLEQNSQDTALIARYAEICEELQDLDYDIKRIECEKMLLGLGFQKTQFSDPVSTLSTGWKMRIVLAKLLLQRADFYLFDEPTNHLDMLSKEWFLHFLKTQHFGFLLVCHEKHFLNALCSNILELERGKTTLYNGNYNTYIHQKTERRGQLLAAYEAQQREIQTLEATINRFRAGTKAKMAQSMIKQLNRMERIEIPPLAKKVTFHFPVIKQSSRIVLTVNNLSFSYEDKSIFKNCSFEIERNSCVAIVAPNGGGKTTLITLLNKTISPNTGSIAWGESIDRAIFNQDQKNTLDQEKTVFENAYNTSGASKERVRSLLGAFLFDSEGIEKKTKVLSGGEQNRLGMVCVLLKNANVLVLDEPTNHLDIPSKEVLLDALQHYEGTIIFVSHDHDFTSGLATHILELKKEDATLFQCNYETYFYQKSLFEEQIAKEGAVISKTKHSSSINKEKRRNIREIEQKISTTEKKIKEIESSFLNLSYHSDAFGEKNQKLKDERQKLETLNREWETFIADIEN